MTGKSVGHFLHSAIELKLDGKRALSTFFSVFHFDDDISQFRRHLIYMDVDILFCTKNPMFVIQELVFSKRCRWRKCVHLPISLGFRLPLKYTSLGV